MVFNHGVNRMTKNSTGMFRANGFYTGGLTTIKPKSSRTIYYDQIEGDLAHCSVFDLKNTALVQNESVINGGMYKLLRFGKVTFLDHKTTKQAATESS